MLYNFWLITTIFLTAFYVGLMVIYTIGWERSQIFKRRTERSGGEEEKSSYQTSVTVIIPARNEEANIAACLSSISKQDYPKDLFEVIVVDDHSTDRTAAIVKGWESAGFPMLSTSPSYLKVKLISLADFVNAKNVQSFKKLAITTAIQQSKSQLIVTTDADCIVSSTWLSTVVDYFERTNFKMITGPVVFETNSMNAFNRFLQRIWALDFAGMMGVTAASLHYDLSKMSNGANLAYTREAFDRVGGFEGIDHIASGDDLLLMEKISESYPNQIGFLKSKKAIVSTPAPANLTEFVQQRIRWASKSRHYQDNKIKIVLALVWIFHVSMWINLLISLSYPHFGMWICGQLLWKSLIDVLFLWRCVRFFGKNSLMWIFLPAEIFQLFYIFIVGLLGNFKKYEWKGREVK